jgi:hypothetical protein
VVEQLELSKTAKMKNLLERTSKKPQKVHATIIGSASPAIPINVNLNI